MSSHPLQINRLLECLPEAEFQRLYPYLELVSLETGAVLYESGATLQHAYFPIDCIVSLMYAMKDGVSSEIAVVGNEGVVGISLFMGGESTTSRAVMQTSGNAFRLQVNVLKEEFSRSAAMRHLLLRYTQALITQMTQIAACNRHHSVEKQLCRWILLGLDRLPDNKMMMIEELPADMLGADCEGVGDAAGNLQAKRLISSSNGRITVLDRQRLEQNACECHALIKKECDRLLPNVTAS